jgi:phosphotransferase system HPr (HPr) family protein
MNDVYKISKVIEINKYINSRHASNLVVELDKINSCVHLGKFQSDSRQVNAKSIIGLLSLGLKLGDEIIICVVNQNKEQCENDMIKVLEIFKNL